MARLDRAIQQARVRAPLSLCRLDGPLLRAMTLRLNANEVSRLDGGESHGVFGGEGECDGVAFGGGA